MPKSSPLRDSPPVTNATDEEAADNNLQPFFVLHKATARRSDTKSPRPVKTKRKIHLPPHPPKSPSKSSGSLSGETDGAAYERFRLEAFDRTWSKIDSAVKEVLRKINLDLFDEVDRWVKRSFSIIKSVRADNLTEIQRPFPIVTDALCRQIPTALILTKNTEFVDDLLTFQELGVHLRSDGCHVARLSALDFLSKHGIGSCLKSLLRQLVSEAMDAADIGALASWYCEPENCDSPVIVVIDDMERCDGATLAEFIRMLSEWVVKIPIIFIMGVATTVDAPRRVLPSDALQHLQPFKFTLGSPCDRMNAIIETVLVKTCSGFCIGHKVAVFLRNYFLKHDGTITSFIRALKIACVKHFSVEPLSFLGVGILDENCEDFWREKFEALPDVIYQKAFELPSCERENVSRDTSNFLIEGLSRLKELQKNWSSVVLCLFEVGKLSRMQLLDIFSEAAELSPHTLRIPDQKLEMPSLIDSNFIDGKFSFAKGGFIAQAIHKVREISGASLVQLLDTWSSHTEEMEVHDKVRQLQSMVGAGNTGQTIKEPLPDIQKRSRSMSAGRSVQSVNDKAALLLDSMVRSYLMPVESMAFHEIVCFKNVEVLQSSLIGDPRRTIQVDLLKSQSHLQCSCCIRGQNALSPFMNDTSIMYNLAQEYGDLINLHDWYQSFKITISSTKTKRKLQHSPASKKIKASPPENEATIQARFCRAVTELQITGLLRMPSKRRPDFIQRVAYGL